MNFFLISNNPIHKTYCCYYYIVYLVRKFNHDYCNLKRTSLKHNLSLMNNNYLFNMKAKSLMHMLYNSKTILYALITSCLYVMNCWNAHRIGLYLFVFYIQQI